MLTRKVAKYLCLFGRSVRVQTVTQTMRATRREELLLKVESSKNYESNRGAQQEDELVGKTSMTRETAVTRHISPPSTFNCNMRGPVQIKAIIA